MGSKSEIGKPSKPATRRYGQYCPVAHSLDALGERWTLLVVRNLMMGPQRYTDLREELPGVATDLLTARLRTLEDAGYVRRRQLPRPASVTVYELTDAGQQLALVVLELARIGLMHLGAPAADEDISAEALVLSLRASFRPEVAGNADESYQLELDGEPFAVRVHTGWAETARGAASDPQLTLATTARTFAQLISRATRPKAAVAAGELEIKGPRRALDRFLAIFSYPASPEPLATTSG
jgi:DNA-binding HxlR family transcriptional regulator/putative sterol carrier protein